MTKSRIAIPKLVAGVPVPKRLRKASFITSILNHPLGRTILADAILAAAGAAATALNKHQSSASPASSDGEAPTPAEAQSLSVTRAAICAACVRRTYVLAGLNPARCGVGHEQSALNRVPEGSEELFSRTSAS